jgi:hypothetical protein
VDEIALAPCAKDVPTDLGSVAFIRPLCRTSAVQTAAGGRKTGWDWVNKVNIRAYNALAQLWLTKGVQVAVQKGFCTFAIGRHQRPLKLSCRCQEQVPNDIENQLNQSLSISINF